jgi:hypothetical protein
MSTEPTTNTPQAGRLDAEWTRREARAYGYPMNAPVQPTLYTGGTTPALARRGSTPSGAR